METTIKAQPEKKLYGKRSLWQWVAIYVVIGTIVYGAIYFFFINKGYSHAAYSDQPKQQQYSY
jgi:flagellar basal body-associated protein FliL